MQGLVALGIRESAGPNRSVWIDYINRRQGNPLSAPYCGAAVGYCLDSAQATAPRYRGGLALGYRERPYVDARDVITGKVSITVGYLGIWRRGSTGKGHIGIVERVIDQRTVVMLEANTSPGPSGSQRDGDGFHRRVRHIEPYNWFGIKYFKDVTYS